MNNKQSLCLWQSSSAVTQLPRRRASIQFGTHRRISHRSTTAARAWLYTRKTYWPEPLDRSEVILTRLILHKGSRNKKEKKNKRKRQKEANISLEKNVEFQLAWNNHKVFFFFFLSFLPVEKKYGCATKLGLSLLYFLSPRRFFFFFFSFFFLNGYNDQLWFQ